MMVKFVTKSKAGVMVGLGLTAENVRRLKLGQPVLVRCADLNIPWEGEIVVMYGETERDIADQLARHIGPQTIVTKDERVDL